MSRFNHSLAILLASLITSVGISNDDEMTTPVSVSKTSNSVGGSKAETHPINSVLSLAHRGLERMKSIKDYKAQLIRRERINGKLSGFEYCDVKIRNAQPEKDIPFSIYMKFTKPRSINGREVIWVDGRNDNKIIAHEAGAILGKITVFLKPEGPIAMRSCRYPIYEAGFKVLTERLIEKAEGERNYGECEVKVEPDQSFCKRPCTLIEVVHPVPREHFDFHIARIFIDDELQLPVRYEAYTWPDEEGGKPVLLEQYLWTKVQLNCELTDDDFNPRSEQYDYCFNEVYGKKPVKVADQKAATRE